VSETAGSPPPVAENGAGPAAENQPQDPWASSLEGVDEVYRPHVEQAINPLREQLSPQLELADRLGPLGDYADDLLALHGMADDDGNALEDFLGFAQMASQVDPDDPQNPANEQFAEWFYAIGEQMGLIDPDDGDEPDEGDDGEESYDDEGEESSEVLALREQLQNMQQTVEQLQAAPRIQSEQQRIQSEVDAAIQEHGLADSEETKRAIMRFARDYVEQPNMVELAVKDLLTLTGGAQRELLNGQETETLSPAGVSPTGGSPNTAPEAMPTGDPAAARKWAKDAARSRLQAAG
jgi:hypothetical protein